MRGLILAGGLGTRLYPLTTAMNKHLVPIGNLPMIEYPLYTLRKLGVHSVSVVTGGEYFQDVAAYLARTHEDMNFSFHYQPKASGIAQAIQVTRPFLEGEPLAVILGDNIFEDDFSSVARVFENTSQGAMIFLKPVEDPERFGVAEPLDDRIISIEEKPKNPKSNLAVTGLYFFDRTVFEKIATLKPSARGELEVTDLNNLYLAQGNLAYHKVKGFWSDAGTYPSRRVCEEFILEGHEGTVINGLPEASRTLILRNMGERA